MRQTLRIAILLAAWSGLARAQVPDRYRSAVEKLDPFIAREVAAKRIPALSIAIVDDQSIVWSRGYGFADPATAKPATADTVYRVGSVSKLFTDIAVMQLVEGGQGRPRCPGLQALLASTSPRKARRASRSPSAR